ncbi:MAG: glutaredoxin family protein [Candidatus Nomurabacteria bacterium]|nr:MAG: glutaredoxin family protein [Candidatus Nomurabacteria bacterium]
MKSVTIYSTPSCHFCHMAKEFLGEKNIEFTDYDVSSDAAKRQEMVEMTGQLGVPVIKIGDDIMVGFHQGKIEELLGL